MERVHSERTATFTGEQLSGRQSVCIEFVIFDRIQQYHLKEQAVLPNSFWAIAIQAGRLRRGENCGEIVRKTSILDQAARQREQKNSLNSRDLLRTVSSRTG